MKILGDLAQFMVQNKLTKETLLERADELSFPKSVVQFMEVSVYWIESLKTIVPNSGSNGTTAVRISWGFEDESASWKAKTWHQTRITTSSRRLMNLYPSSIVSLFFWQISNNERKSLKKSMDDNSETLM